MSVAVISLVIDAIGQRVFCPRAASTILFVRSATSDACWVNVGTCVVSVRWKTELVVLASPKYGAVESTATPSVLLRADVCDPAVGATKGAGDNNEIVAGELVASWPPFGAIEMPGYKSRVTMAAATMTIKNNAF